MLDLNYVRDNLDKVIARRLRRAEHPDEILRSRLRVLMRSGGA